MKKLVIVICVLSLIAFFILFSFNHFLLQAKMNDIINNDPRNKGVEVSVHFRNYIHPSILVYSLKAISGDNSMLDVFRVFLQYAEKMKSREFDVVELSYQGKTKFKISGDYFKKLGEEYSFQNPAYTIRTFPENLVTPDGSRAYPKWSGGWLGVLGKQMEDFNDFHKRWYLEDMVI